MSSPNPPKDGDLLGDSIEEEDVVGQLEEEEELTESDFDDLEISAAPVAAASGHSAAADPLVMAKEDARASGRLTRSRSRQAGVSSEVVNLNPPRKPAEEMTSVYLRAEGRERLTRLAYTMSCSYGEVIRQLSLLRFAQKEGLLLGYAPGDEIILRTVLVKAVVASETTRRLEKIARVCHLGRARNTASMVVDAILGDRVVLTGYPDLEAAAEQVRRSPIEALQELAEQLDPVDGRITLRLSTPAAKGIIAIMNEFDRRRDWNKVHFKRAVEALADLPVTYQLVGEVLAIRRAQRPLTLPIWAVQKLAQIGLDNMLVEKPVYRRPSALVSETLEYIGQGAIQLIHNRRDLDSTETLARSKAKAKVRKAKA